MYQILMKALYTFGANLIVTAISEQMIAWGFFKVAHWLVLKTPTKVDDEFIEKLEERYKGDHHAGDC